MRRRISNSAQQRRGPPRLVNDDHCAPMAAFKPFMFLFVGGLVGTIYYLLGLAPAGYIPLVILLAGLGAVFCLSLFDR